jgi:hypothetical protein
MRWHRSLPLIATLGLVAALMGRAAPRSSELPRYLLTDREAFLLRDAELVVLPPVAAAEWSPDGRYVLAAREQRPSESVGPPSGEISLVLWSRRTGRSQELWKRPPAIQAMDQIDWLPRQNAALVLFSWLQTTGDKPVPHRVLLRVDAARAQVRTLGEIQQERLIVSPGQPVAILCDDEQQTVRIMRSDGGIGPPIRVPASLFGARWSPEGNRLYLPTGEPPAARGQPPIVRWHAVNLDSGGISALPQAPELYEARALPVRLKPSVAMLKEEATSQRVHPLWLESGTKSEQPRALVSADSEWAKLAPDAGSVLFGAHGAAWVIPVTRMPGEQWLTQVRAAQREEVVSNARQIGTALMMYVQDYDETFPPAGSAVIDQLGPYVKNREVFNSPGQDSPGFVYLYNTNTLANIKEPASTVVGYLPGPGGRATLYADGHVRWQSD